MGHRDEEAQGDGRKTGDASRKRVFWENRRCPVGAPRMKKCSFREQKELGEGTGSKNHSSQNSPDGSEALRGFGKINK